jgi:uncharacterized RmlC-like cupin family protein
MPSGYKFPAHHHPKDEYVTVISATSTSEWGDKLDEKKAIELTAGGYVEAPAKMNHYGWVSSPSGSNSSSGSVRDDLRQSSRWPE